MRELLRAALTAAVAGDGQALADTMDPDVTAWDAVGGTVTGGAGSRHALIALPAPAGAEPGYQRRVDPHRRRHCCGRRDRHRGGAPGGRRTRDAPGDRLAEIRSYADPAGLHRWKLRRPRCRPPGTIRSDSLHTLADNVP